MSYVFGAFFFILIFLIWVRWISLERRVRQYSKRLQRIGSPRSGEGEEIASPFSGDIPTFTASLTPHEVEQLLLNDAINRFSADYVALVSYNNSDGAYQVLLASRKNLRGDHLRQALINRFSSFFTSGDTHAIGWSEHLFETGFKENLTLLGFHSSYSALLGGQEQIVWLGFTEQRSEARYRHGVEEYLRIVGRRLDDYRHIIELQDKYSREKELTAERTRLLAYAAHDMRSPLNNIKITLAHLQSHGREEVDDDLLAGALHSCHLLDEIVDDALDYTRFKVGALRAQPHRLICADIVSRVCRSFEQLARDKKLSLMYEIPRSLELVVDSKQFGRMLSNVIGNAIKYTEKGGIIVAARSGEAGRVTISVRDSGIGMNEAEVSAMFDPYVRFGDQSEKGVGLGLALTKAFSDLNNCMISVSSVPAQGTIVTIDAPGGIAEDVDITPSFINGDILIADDSADYAKSLVRSLNRFGYQAKVVASIGEAKSYLRCDKPQYLITDLSFADGDGEGLVRFALVENCADTVIIASGREVLAAHKDILDRKNVYYLRKPFELSDLLAFLTRNCSYVTSGDASYERKRQSGVSIS